MTRGAVILWLVTAGFFFAAIWTTDPVSDRLAGTGVVMFIIAFAVSMVASVVDDRR